MHAQIELTIYNLLLSICQEKFIMFSNVSVKTLISGNWFMFCYGFFPSFDKDGAAFEFEPNPGFIDFCTNNGTSPFSSL